MSNSSRIDRLSSLSGSCKESPTLIEIDYGQIEMRLLAAYANSSIKDIAADMMSQDSLSSLTGEARQSFKDSLLRSMYSGQSLRFPY